MLWRKPFGSGFGNRVPSHFSLVSRKAEAKPEKVHMEKVVPLISPGTVGPLGLCHLPRLWLKMLLAVSGRLPRGYRHGAAGFDEALLRAIDVDVDELAHFVELTRPSYLQFETWIEQNAHRLDAQTIAAFNDAVRTRTKAVAQLEVQRPSIGMDDDSITNAVLVNDLDDWMTLHAQVTTGMIPFIVTSLSAELSEILKVLVAETRAGHVTVRVGVPRLHLELEQPAAEARRKRGESSIDRSFGCDEVAYVSATWKQCREPIMDSATSSAVSTLLGRRLGDVFEIRAFMIVPVRGSDLLGGWLSIYDDHPRGWSARDLEAAQRSADEVALLISAVTI
jgi:hypothetical protein